MGKTNNVADDNDTDTNNNSPGVSGGESPENDDDDYVASNSDSDKLDSDKIQELVVRGADSDSSGNHYSDNDGDANDGNMPALQERLIKDIVMMKVMMTVMVILAQ